MAKRNSETVVEDGLSGLEELDTDQGNVEVVDSGLEPLETARDDSPTIVTPPPRPRGGVRNDGGIPGTTRLDRYTPVPAPRYRKFLSTAENPHQNSRAAWKYWMALPDWAKSQIDAYVYRDHPILLEPPVDQDTGKPLYLSSIDKIPGGSPITDDLDLLNRYGCGSYHIYLSETASTKKGDKSICQIWVQNVGSNNYRSNPPTDSRVTDVDQVDLDHPANKAYVSYLRAEGRLPEQIDGKVKEHEMATIEAVKEVTTQQGTLVKEIINMAKDRSQNSENASRAQAEVMADTIKTSNDMTREAAKQSIGMVKEAFDQAKAMLPTATAPTSDPITMALALVDAIKKSSGDNAGSNAEVLELRSQLNQFLQRQIDSQQKQIELLMEAKVTNPAAATSPFSAMKEGLESLEQFNGVMERLRGGKDEGEDAVVDAVADAAPKWMRPILPILPGLAQGLLGWLQTRNQQPQPAYYQTSDGRILPLAQPQVVAPQPQIQAPLYPGQRPVQQFGPQPVPSPANNPAQDPIYALLSSITVPLLNNLQVNGTGSDFADWFIGGYGQQVYDEVMQLGPDMLFTAISTFPPINTNPIYQQTPVEQVQAFINEFCDPKWPEEGEGDEVGEKRTEPGTGPVPA